MNLNTFLGIAPRFGKDIKPGYAVTAENVDLSSGKISAKKSDLLVKANTTGVNSIFYYRDDWESGRNRYYLQWKIGLYDILVYLKDGVPYKKVNGHEAILGQSIPAAPEVAEAYAGSLNDTYNYIVTTTRNVGGYTDESGPSEPSQITVSSKTITVTAPTVTDTDVTHWNIYRVSNSSGSYQFVAQVPIGTSSYVDNITDSSLDTSPTTFYTSDQGNIISWNKPLTTFDGLSTKPQNGMIMAWKDSSVYWNEPGYMDAWPSFYSVNFPAKVKRVIPFAGSWAILTENGPYRLDGTHPELLRPSDVLGVEPCIGTAACITSRGAIYLSDSGITLFNLIDNTIITDENFTEEWFSENISADGAVLEENDNQFFLFHSGGCLIGDFRNSPAKWYTAEIYATASAKRLDNGALYYLDSAGVKQLSGGTSSLSWTWKSGNLLEGGGADTKIGGVEVVGGGSITVSLYVDDVRKVSRSIGHRMYRDRRISPPKDTFGRALQIEMSGTGEVTEIITQVL